jgi:hypothetical protein
MSLLRTRGQFVVAGGAATLLVAVLLIVFRDPLTRSVALPAAWIAWAFRAASVVVGQRIVWWLGVLIFAGAALGALRAARPAAGPPRAPARPEDARSRLAHWEAVVALDSGAAAGRHVLVHELRSLALSVLSRTEGVEPVAMEARLVSDADDLPSCLHDLFGETYLRQTRRRRGRAEPLGPLPLAQILEALETRLRGVPGGQDAPGERSPPRRPSGER